MFGRPAVHYMDGCQRNRLASCTPQSAIIGSECRQASSSPAPLSVTVDALMVRNAMGQPAIRPTIRLCTNRPGLRVRPSVGRIGSSVDYGETQVQTDLRWLSWRVGKGGAGGRAAVVSAAAVYSPDSSAACRRMCREDN